MADKNLIGIINCCISIDQEATEIYRKLSRLASTKGLKAFWKEMFIEENEHVAFWKGLLKLANKGLIPPLFESPEQVREDLEMIRRKVAALSGQTESWHTAGKAFALAFQMEFHVLHPAFAVLLDFLNITNTTKRRRYNYKAHLGKLIRGLRKHETVTPEMDLLSQATIRLWNEHARGVEQNRLDPLTGVLNRRGLTQATQPLAHLANRNQYDIAIMMIDIDNFKRINDTKGHLAGDKALRLISQLISSCIRRSDLVARYGGDEFFIFLAQIRPEALRKIAEKIRRRVIAESSKRLKYTVTLTVGAACGKLGEKVERDLLRLTAKADRCLYEGKRAGRNQVVVAA